MTGRLAIVVSLVVVACGAPNGGDSAVAVWDLRETRSVEAVGWPEDVGSVFEARSEEGLERILRREGL